MYPKFHLLPMKFSPNLTLGSLELRLLCFWLHWVFAATPGLSPAVARGGHSPVLGHGLGLSSCGARALLVSFNSRTFSHPFPSFPHSFLLSPSLPLLLFLLLVSCYPLPTFLLIFPLLFLDVFFLLFITFLFPNTDI